MPRPALAERSPLQDKGPERQGDDPSGVFLDYVIKGRFNSVPARIVTRKPLVIEIYSVKLRCLSNGLVINRGCGLCSWLRGGGV